eukprot:COSAG02_NODE_41075_length_398_cov_1.040134_1_plen_22_part_10
MLAAPLLTMYTGEALTVPRSTS